MGKKTKIIINPKKELLMKESIRALLQAELAELKEASKKKLDPVGPHGRARPPAMRVDLVFLDTLSFQTVWNRHISRR